MKTYNITEEQREQIIAAINAQVHGTDTTKLSYKGDQASGALAVLRSLVPVNQEPVQLSLPDCAITAGQPSSLLLVRDAQEEVLRITPKCEIFHRGLRIYFADDMKAAMADLAKTLCKTYVPQPAPAEPKGECPNLVNCGGQCFQCEYYEGLAAQEPEAYSVYNPATQTQTLEFDDDLGDMDGCVIEPLYLAAGATPERSCTWTPDDTFNDDCTWHSACGELWSFIDGGPAENRVKYCHYCGGKVVIAGQDSTAIA